MYSPARFLEFSFQIGMFLRNIKPIWRVAGSIRRSVAIVRQRCTAADNPSSRNVLGMFTVQPLAVVLVCISARGCVHLPQLRFRHGISAACADVLENSWGQQKTPPSSMITTSPCRLCTARSGSAHRYQQQRRAEKTPERRTREAVIGPRRTEHQPTGC